MIMKKIISWIKKIGKEGGPSLQNDYQSRT